MMLPETHASTASVAPMMAEVPVARPSMPSVRLAPFDTAVMISITMGMKMIHIQLEALSPIQLMNML